MFDKVVRVISRFLLAVGLLKKMIIVRIDGGICSQMHFFLIGQYFKKNGYLVKYDLRWFNSQGMDLTGKFERNFDLLKAFPSLDFCKAKLWEIFFYSRLSFPSSMYKTAQPPAYMDGYYGNSREMYMDEFPRLFSIDLTVLDEINKRVYNEIKQFDNSVAIHVRRGDLATYNGAYGKPVDLAYFKKVIQKIQLEYGKLQCYIFSDEPEWVKRNLQENLPRGNTYTVVDFNGSDKGYMDMFLISACKFQITSKGSLGKFGGFLNKKKEGKIYIFNDSIEQKNWSNIHDKIEFID